MSDKISEAVNILLQAARREFEEPDGGPELYRMSISPDGTRLEVMHSTRRPLEWRILPVTLAKEQKPKAGVA